eukprot:gnl/TRDRNA2_/TRDRNA2_202190_c0_seq1.p1 gnl/TRDRNA2_/TRDRNA2_202190_c0~~gnl/TRDRNA2_/TRDRNA2_202190_c0_seq1.p1  ORF type:complete len:224 (+),score=23.80 gnl/TRDRNA2_/TRDRNA2_202190_c0_seq1:98-769(+)
MPEDRPRRSRSPVRGHPGYNPFNPLTAGNCPHPTQAPPASLSQNIERLRAQAKWKGEKARPWEVGWVDDCHKRSLDTQKWLCHDRDDSGMLWNEMPRNATGNYARLVDMRDKVEYMWKCLNFHSEVREVYGYWEKVHAPMPSPEDRAWYHRQYTKGAAMPQEANAFLHPGDHAGEHYQRQSWCFSLAGLFELYRNTWSAEVIYEFWKSLPVMVSKKPRNSRRA